ncbi:MAG: methyltransferase [Frankiaceae bacterium]|nr:methyltransferase [Frankiaceae bacterium]
MTPQDRHALLLAHTSLRRPDIVPEVELHLVDDIVALWKVTGEDDPPPFWAVAWLGGQALARYVLDHPEQVRGRRVLDLGSGSGLVAIAATLAGAAHVLAADIDPFCSTAIEVNARANGVDVEVTLEDLLEREPPAVDVVLAGDVWYEQSMAERATAWLVRSPASVLLGDPGRTYLPRDGWVELAAYDVPTTRDLEGVESKRVRVFSPAPR